MLPGLTPFFGIAALLVNPTFQQVTSQSGGTTTFTFTSVPLGPAVRKTVIIAVHDQFGSSQFNLSSATIDGVSATIQVQQSDEGGSTGMGVAIITAVTANTTGTVSITFSGTTSSCNIGVYYASPILNNIHTQAVLGHNNTNISGTIIMPANGNIVVAGTGSSNTGGHTSTLTGATANYDIDGQTGIGRSSAGLATKQASNASYAIGFNMGVISNSGTVMVALTWN